MNAAVYVSRRRRVREGRGLLHFVALGLGGVSRPDVYVSHLVGLVWCRSWGYGIRRYSI